MEIKESKVKKMEVKYLHFFLYKQLLNSGCMEYIVCVKKCLGNFLKYNIKEIGR